MPDYNTYNRDQLIELQQNLAQTTGEPINGILGGLPVASQNQAFFVVFDEAGSTGPEIIEKTQFRITYLVNANLETSKPVANSPAAFNITQNFEKSKICKVRADNATVLNQNLTGEQAVYDVGTLRLISTTEYGKGKDEYITTMSFNGLGSQDIIGNAQDISGLAGGNEDDRDENNLNSAGTLQVRFSNIITPISQSAGGYEWVEYTTDPSHYDIIQDTVVAGTRAKFVANATHKVNGVQNQQTVNFVAKIQKEDSAGIKTDLDTFTYAVTNRAPGTTLNRTINISLDSGFQNFNNADEITFLIVRSGNDGPNSYVEGGTFELAQETPQGDILIMGVNATTASYWSGFENVSGSGVDPNDLNQAYAILTASAEFGNFANGQFQQRIATASEAFDPELDGNTFNPIQSPLEFLTGDEIRFEYNKNKVHKVIRTVRDVDGLKVYIQPGIDTQTLLVADTIGTQLNHFTHYRIDPDGGYLIINQVKDNVAGVDQDFKGIITPQYPSEALKAKEDELIFELKTAGIIET